MILSKNTLVVFVCLLFCSGEAKGRGNVIITWGESISHIGDVAPLDLRSMGNDKVGFVYSRFGIFWVDLWTWGGKYCLYHGDRYRAIPASLAALYIGKKESDLGAPLLYRCPLGWMIIGPFLLCVGVAAIVEVRKQKKLDWLHKDPSYKKALEIVNQEISNPIPDTLVAQAKDEKISPDGGPIHQTAFKAGVEYLNSIGIPPEEAAQNLTLLILGMAQNEQPSKPVAPAKSPEVAKLNAIEKIEVTSSSDNQGSNQDQLFNPPIKRYYIMRPLYKVTA